jgi:hypothetical protein
MTVVSAYFASFAEVVPGDQPVTLDLKLMSKAAQVGVPKMDRPVLVRDLSGFATNQALEPRFL